MLIDACNPCALLIEGDSKNSRSRNTEQPELQSKNTEKNFKVISSYKASLRPGYMRPCLAGDTVQWVKCLLHKQEDLSVYSVLVRVLLL